jgi:hypothetical protein
MPPRRSTFPGCGKTAPGSREIKQPRSIVFGLPGTRCGVRRPCLRSVTVLHVARFWQSPEVQYAGAVPFFYDPARGNLLLDIRSSGIDWAPNPRPLSGSSLDAHDVPGDSVSRAVAFSLDTDIAEMVDSTGLVTAFGFYPTLNLAVRYETNSVILNWPTKPRPFRLQWSDTVGSGPPWSDYPGTIGGNSEYQELILPAESLAARKYFRLFWDTPQPLAESPSTAPLQVDPIEKP